MNSNRAMEIIYDLWSVTSVELPVNVFFETPTIRRMAAGIHDGSALIAPDLALLRAGDDSPPLFLFPGGGGNLVELTDLVQALDYAGAVYGIAFSGLDGVGPFPDRFDLEAERSLGIIQEVQAAGPYRLFGYSIGGVTALETARLIRRQGEQVFLGLIDAPQNDHSWPYTVWAAFLLRKFSIKARKLIRLLSSPRTGRKPAPTRRDINPRRRGTQFMFRFRNPGGPNYPYYSPYWVAHHTPNYSRVCENACRMKGFYTPTSYDGEVSFFASAGGDYLACDPEKVWPKYLPHAEWIRVPGNHLSMMFGRKAAWLADAISVRLKQAAGAAGDEARPQSV